jgi:hypothetical protein
MARPAKSVTLSGTCIQAVSPPSWPMSVLATAKPSVRPTPIAL